MTLQAVLVAQRVRDRPRRGRRPGRRRWPRAGRGRRPRRGRGGGPPSRRASRSGRRARRAGLPASWVRITAAAPRWSIVGSRPAGAGRRSGASRRPGRRPPGRRMRMSLTWWRRRVRPGNHTNGMPRRSAERICLPNFCGAADTSVGMPRARSAGGDVVAGAAGLLVDHGDQHGARHRPAAGQRRRRPAAGRGAGDTERDADARVGRPPVGRERVVPPTAAHGLEVLEALHVDLDDGAGVVVEAARDRAGRPRPATCSVVTAGAAAR